MIILSLCFAGHVLTSLSYAQFISNLFKMLVVIYTVMDVADVGDGDGQQRSLSKNLN